MNQIESECSCPCSIRITKLEQKIALLLNIIERSKNLREIQKDLEQQNAIQPIQNQQICQAQDIPPVNTPHIDEGTSLSTEIIQKRDEKQSNGQITDTQINLKPTFQTKSYEKQNSLQQSKNNKSNQNPNVIHKNIPNAVNGVAHTSSASTTTLAPLNGHETCNDNSNIQNPVNNQKVMPTMNNASIYINDEVMDVKPVQINTDCSEQKPVFLDKELVRTLKPHQIEGVKFLWKLTNKNLGCILADSCGLGKTFQVIAFLHCLYEEKMVKTVLIVVPAAVLRNWCKEYNFWLSFNTNRPPIISFEPSLYKSDDERSGILLHWHKTGGLLVISYAMYRRLCFIKKDESPTPLLPLTSAQINYLEIANQCLVDPGPDIVVLDEGHQIRDLSSEISRTLKSIKTQRRIILTGCPLQNNLLEYWCMVDFVRSGFLGTHDFFLKAFAEPVASGGFLDSNQYEKQRSSWRVWVLYDMLSNNVILRRDSSLLANTLPPKQEYVISVKLSQVQQKLYHSFVTSYSNRRNMFWWFEIIVLLCNHPDILCNYIKVKKEQLKKATKIVEQKEKEDAQKENTSTFIEDEVVKDDIFDFDILSSVTSESKLDNQQKKAPTEQIELNMQRLSWVDTTLQELNYKPDIIETSGKMLVLLEIIQASVLVGDKLVVFSQSLFTLNYIQHTLDDYNKLMVSRGAYSHQFHYLRFDGNTNLEERENKIALFNKKDSHYKIFLISTKSGGEGLNLTGGNRVVLFDNCWNPSRDIEASLRIYRYGQQKPVFIYRLLVTGSMETKIYYRNVLKESMARKIVDQQPAIRTITKDEIKNLFAIPEITDESPQIEGTFGDRVLDHIVKKCESWITKIHYHDSMFLLDETQKLSIEEQHNAWDNYQLEKKAVEKSTEQSSTSPARAITYSQIYKAGAGRTKISARASEPETFLDWLVTDGEKGFSDSCDKNSSEMDYNINNYQQEILLEKPEKQNTPDYDSFLLKQSPLSPTSTQIAIVTANNALTVKKKDKEMAQMIENRKRNQARRKRKEDQYNGSNKKQRVDDYVDNDESSDLYQYDDSLPYPELSAQRDSFSLIPTDATYISGNYGNNFLATNYCNPPASSITPRYQNYQQQRNRIDKQYWNQPQQKPTTGHFKSSKEKEIYSQVIEQLSEKMQSDETNAHTFKQIRDNICKIMQQPVLTQDKK